MNERKNSHYFSKFPDSKLKVHSVSESLRRHLYLFKTVTGVFSYKKIDLGTKILIQYMTIPSDSCTLLDLGCGYGPIGMVLAYESPKSNVYMIDINVRAIWCAKENVKLNIRGNRKRIQVLESNFFEAFKSKEVKFDAIYMNPPIRQGREKFLEVYNQIFETLTPDGFFEFVMRKKLGAGFLYKHLREIHPDHQIEIITKKSGYWVFHCS